MNDQRIIGIDLGTTYSLAAEFVNGKPVIIQDDHGPIIVPSIVSLTDEGSWLVGDNAKDFSLANPCMTVFSVKRFMGKSLSDIGEDAKLLPFEITEKATADDRNTVAIRLGKNLITPEEISAAILKEISKRTRHQGKVVVTVPAYFDDSQRQATRDAGRMAGLDVIRIVNEPTAAALAYGLDRKKNGVVAVYDLGGGTFDCTILSIKDGVFKVLSTRGDTRLGGDDFDRILMELVIRLSGLDRSTILSPGTIQAIRVAAESAKRTLSYQSLTNLEWQDPSSGKTHSMTITRETFESSIQHLVDLTIVRCQQALKDAKLSPAQIEEVVMVGGSSRVPLVRQQVQQLFGKKPHTDINPDEVVALGAAIQAEILSGRRKQTLLLDVVPLSLGIETLGGAVTKLINRNSPLPAKAIERFTTGVDNQTAVIVNIFQGERELAKDCKKLGEFKLTGIPPMPAQMAQVDVAFLVDANGILTVTAKEIRSGTEAKVTVTPAHGLTKDEVDRIVLESVEHAREDFHERRTIELIEKGKGLASHTRKVLENPEHEVLPEERTAIGSALSHLEQAISSRDGNRIQSSLDHLSKVTNPLAERMMNKTVQAALKDRKLDDVIMGVQK